MKLNLVLTLIYVVINNVLVSDNELGRLSRQINVLHPFSCFTENYQNYLIKLQTSLDLYTKACNFVNKNKLTNILKYYMLLEEFRSRLILKNPKLPYGNLLTSLENDKLEFTNKNKSLILSKIKEIVDLVKKNKDAMDQLNSFRKFMKGKYIYSPKYPKFTITNLKRLIKYNKVKIHLSNILLSANAKQNDCLPSNFDYVPIVANQIEFMSEVKYEIVSIIGYTLAIKADFFEQEGVAVSFWINENVDFFNQANTDVLEIFNGLIDNKVVNNYSIVKDKQDQTKLNHVFRFANNTITIQSSSNCSQYAYFLMTIQKLCDSYKLIVSMRFPGVNKRSLFDLALKKDEVEKLTIVFNNNPIFALRKLSFYKNFLYSHYTEMRTIFEDFEDHSYSNKADFTNKNIPAGSLKECNIPPTCVYSASNNLDSCDICKKGFFNYNKKCVPKCPDGTYQEKVTNKDEINCIHCDEDCELCTYKNNCIKCKSPVNNILYNGKCSSGCPDNTIATNKTIHNHQILTCVKCDENCDICAFNKCITCKTPYYNFKGKCVKDCSEGYYKDEITSSCHKCDTRCRSCEGTGFNKNKCKECDKGYYLLNGFCYEKCLPGYHQNMATGVCQECPDYCSSCPTDKSSCLHCKTGFKITTDPITKKHSCVNICKEGHIEINGACTTCKSEDCLVCKENDLSLCTTCKKGKKLKNGKCVNDCGLSYYFDTNSSKCKRCNTNCQKCTEGNHKCLECVKPKLLLNEITCVDNCPDGYVKYGSVCVKCHNSDKCRQCTAGNSHICTECFNGLLLHEGLCLNVCPDKNFPRDGKCLQCIQGCDECTNKNSCIKCSNGFVKKNGVCVKECGSGFTLHEKKKICEKCTDPSCDSCPSTNLHSCNVCTNPSYLYNLRCVPECPPKTFPNSKNQCQNCKEGCNKCTNEKDCKVCNNDKFLQNAECKDVCENGYTNNLGISNECIPCTDKTCKKCHSNPNKCDECIYPKLEYKGKCIDSPPPGTHEEDKKIKDCDKLCKTCEKTSKNCTSCNDGLKLKDHTCVDDCPKNKVVDPKDNKKCNECNQSVECKKCNPYDVKECFSCEKDYKLDLVSKTCVKDCPENTFEKSSGVHCEKCPEKCDKCESKTGKCIKCSQGYSLLGNECFENCPSRFVSITNIDNFASTCSPCDSKNCKKCFYGNKKICYECDSGFVLHDGNCLENCPSGFYKNPNTNTCNQCTVDNCETCKAHINTGATIQSTQSNSCYLCKDGFYLDLNKCVKSCRDGYKINQITHQCEACDAKNCKDCKNDKSKCDTCQTGFHLNNEKNHCEADCRNGMFLNKDNGSCESCDKDCLMCNSRNNCIKCELTSVLYEGRCPHYCPSGYLMNPATRTCEPCKDAQCVNCVDHSTCINCKLPYVLHDHHCVKECPEGFFLDHDTSSCKPCTKHCKKCQSQEKCIICDKGKHLIENRHCSDNCPDQMVSKEGKCIPCKTNIDCKKCNVNDVNLCDECHYPLVKLNELCKPDCGERYYKENRDCKKCSKNCLECLDDKECVKCEVDKVLFNKKCEENCLVGYYNKDGKCIPCNKGCLKCDNNGGCTQCNSPDILSGTRCVSECEIGKYLDQYTKKCEPCRDPCSKCSPNGTCLECKSPYLLNKEKSVCIEKCEDGCAKVGRTCEPCNTNCKVCNPSTKDCITCKENKVLFEGMCIDECPLAKGYYLDKNDKTCKKCKEECGQCLGPNNCIKCIAPKVIYNNKCVETCPDGTVKTDDNCKNCVSINCKSCPQNPQNCITCEIPKVLFKNNCIDKCPSNTFERDGKCYECMTNCANCVNENTCVKCTESTKLINIPYLKQDLCLSECGVKKAYDVKGNCANCTTVNCEICENFKPEKCTKCEKNLYLYTNGTLTQCSESCPSATYYDSNQKKCIDCKDGCVNCQDSEICKKCRNGLILHMGNCVERCPKGYIEKDLTCIKCEKDCDLCEKLQTNKCIKCDTNFYLTKDGSCVPNCNYGSFIQTIDDTKKCIPCSNECQECTSSENCVKCNSPNMLYNRKCIPDCPEGWVDNGNGVCKQCPGQCKKCDQNKPDSCLNCLDPYKLYNGKCVPSCGDGYKEIDGVCVKCREESCASCKNGIDNCDICRYPKSIYNGQCVPTCPTGYTNVNGICIKCLVYDCQTCPPNDLSICEVCNNGYLTSTNGIYKCLTECEDGYYADEMKCKPCGSPRCSKCSSKDNCDKCKDNFKQNKGDCIDECNDGSVRIETKNEITRKPVVECLKCKTVTPNCRKCDTTDLTQCTECSDGYVLFNNNCYKVCPEGTFEYSKGKCSKCDAKCKSCSDNSYNCSVCIAPYLLDTTTNSCLTDCNPGYVNIKGKCVKCLTDDVTCKYCDETKLNSCKVCKDGQNIYNGSCVPFCTSGTYFDASSTTCFDCPDNCDVCQNSFNNFKKLQCIACKSGFYFYEGKCVKNCPDSTVLSDDSSTMAITDGTIPPPPECRRCYDSNCKNCDASNRDKCIVCLSPYKLYADKCLKDCPISFYSDINRICKNCDIYCAECNSSACTKCIPPKVLSKAGLCVDSDPVCNPGQIFRDGACYSCTDIKCGDCNPVDLSICNKCKDGYLKFGNTCVESCPDGYFTGANNKCEKCLNLYCNKCNNNSGKCDKCVDRYYKKDGVCVPCSEKGYVIVGDECKYCAVNKCEKCIDGNVDACEDCSAGSFLTSNKICDVECGKGHYKSKNKCLPCEPECLQCENFNGKCIKCKNNFVNHDNKCIDKCPAGFTEFLEPISDALRCRKCRDVNCLECNKNDPSNCLKCNSPYINLNAECVINCPVGYILSSEKTCVKCPEYCVSCLKIDSMITIFSKNTKKTIICDVCQKGFKLKNGECVSECGTGYYEDDKEKCIRCTDSNCKRCNPQDTCKTCETPYMLDKTTDKCVMNCPDGYYKNTESNTCDSCNSNCKLCSNKSSCIICEEEYKFFNGTCLSNCPSGLTSINSRCESCTDKNCEKCEENRPDHCQICNSKTYLMDSLCSPICKVGTYANSTTHKCESCDYMCKTCSDSTHCDACKSEFYFENGYCKNKCMEGKVEHDGKCVCCNDHNCETCLTDLKTCIKCKPQFGLLDNECINSCPLGYFNNKKRECEKCIEGCEFCYNSENCKKCATGYYLNAQNQCVKKCESGYYGDYINGICSTCHESCQTCIDGTNLKCSICAKNFYKSDNLCVSKDNCKFGTFPDDNKRKCVSCKIPNCDLCLNKDICKKCINGFTLSKDGITCSEYKTKVNVIRSPVIFSEDTYEKYNTYNEYSIYEQLKSSCVESKYFTLSFWIRMVTSDFSNNTILLEIKEKQGVPDDASFNKTYINFKLVLSKENEYKCVSEVKYGNFAASEIVYDDCSFNKLKNWNFFSINLNNDREVTSHNMIVYESGLNSTFYVRKNITNFFDRSSIIISKSSHLYIDPHYKTSPIFEIANMYLNEYIPNSQDIENAVNDKPYNCDSQCKNCESKSSKCLACLNGKPNRDGYCPSAFLSINQGLLHIKDTKTKNKINSVFSSRYLSSIKYTFITSFYISDLTQNFSLFSLGYRTHINIMTAKIIKNELQLEVANLPVNKFINSKNNKIQVNKWYIIQISITNLAMSVKVYDASDVSKKQIIISEEQEINYNNNDFIYRLTPDAVISFLSNSVTFSDIRIYTNNVLNQKDLKKYLDSFKCSDNCATCDNNFICLKCMSGFEFNPITKECSVLSLGKPSLIFNRKSIYSKTEDKLESHTDYLDEIFTISIWMRKNIHSPLIPQNGKTDRAINNLISFHDRITKKSMVLLRQEVRDNFESDYVMDNTPLISEAPADKPKRLEIANYLSYYFRRLESMLSTTSESINPKTIRQEHSVNYKNSTADWIHVTITQEKIKNDKVMTVFIYDRNTNYKNQMTFTLHPSLNFDYIVLGDSSTFAINMDFGPNHLYTSKAFKDQEEIIKLRTHPPKDCDPACLDCDYSNGFCKLCANDNLQSDRCDIFYNGKTSAAIYDNDKYSSVISNNQISYYNTFLKDIFKNSINSEFYTVTGWFQLFSIEKHNEGESLLLRLSHSDTPFIKEDDPLYKHYPGLNLISLKIIYEPAPVYAFVLSDSDKEKVIKIKDVTVEANKWLLFVASINVQTREFNYHITLPVENKTFSGKLNLEFIPQKLQNIATLKLFGLDSTVKQIRRPAFGYFYNTYVVTNRVLDLKNVQEYSSLIDPTILNKNTNTCSASCSKCLLGNCFNCEKGYMLNNNECVPEKMKANYILITDQNEIVNNRFSSPVDSSKIISDSFGFQFSIRKNFFSGKASIQKILEFGEISFHLESSETDSYIFIKIQNKNEVPSTLRLGPLDPDSNVDYDWHTVVLNFKGKQSLLECLLFNSKSLAIETKAVKFQIQGKSFDSITLDDINGEVSLFGAVFIIGYDKMTEPLLLTPEVDCPLDCVYCEKNNVCKLCTYGDEFNLNESNNKVCKTKYYSENNMIISNQNPSKNVIAVSSLFSNKKLLRFKEFMLTFSLSIKGDYKYNNILKIINNPDISLKNYDPQNISYNLLTLSCIKEKSSIKFLVSYHNRHSFFKFKHPVTKEIAAYPSTRFENDLNYIGIGYNAEMKTIEISLINSEENRITASIKIDGVFENLGSNTHILFLDDFLDLNKDNQNTYLAVKDIKFDFDKTHTSRDIENILLPNYRRTVAGSCSQIDTDTSKCKKCSASNILLDGRCISKSSNPKVSYALYTDKIITKFVPQEYRSKEIFGGSNSELLSFTLQFNYRRFSYQETDLNSIFALTIFDSQGIPISNIYELYETNNSIIGIFKFHGTDTITVINDFTDIASRFEWIFINIQIDLKEASNSIYVYNYQNEKVINKKTFMLNKPAPSDAKIIIHDKNNLGIDYELKDKEITIDPSIISNPPIIKMAPGLAPEYKLSNLILTTNYIYNENELVSLLPAKPSKCTCACPCIRDICPINCQLDKLWINLSTNLQGSLKTISEDISQVLRLNNPNIASNDDINEIDSVRDYHTFTLSFNLKVQSVLNNMKNTPRRRFSRKERTEQISSKSATIGSSSASLNSKASIGGISSTASISSTSKPPQISSSISSVGLGMNPSSSTINGISNQPRQSFNDDPSLLLVLSNQDEFFKRRMSSGERLSDDLIEYPIISFKIVNKRLRIYLGSYKPAMYVSYKDVDIDLSSIDSLFVLLFADFNDRNAKLIVYADNKRVDLTLDINFSVENLNSRTFYYTNNSLNEIVLKLTNNIELHMDKYYKEGILTNNNTLCPKTCKTCTFENRCLECGPEMKLYNNACIKAKNDKNNPQFRHKLNNKKTQNSLKGKIYNSDN